MIVSRDNDKLKLVRKLHERRWRDKLGLFVVEGEDLVDAALAAGVEPEALLVAGEDVEPELLAAVSELGSGTRVIGVFPQRWSEPGGRLSVYLHGVHDPGNVGTLLRAADALGPAFVALSPGCADPIGAKALRAAMGAVFRVPLARFEEALRPRIALLARGGTPLSDVELGERATFVLGAERDGLPDDVLAACDAVATIPLAGGAESLNVAVAGSIALYEHRRRLS